MDKMEVVKECHFGGVEVGRLGPYLGAQCLFLAV